MTKQHRYYEREKKRIVYRYSRLHCAHGSRTVNRRSSFWSWSGLDCTLHALSKNTKLRIPHLETWSIKKKGVENIGIQLSYGGYYSPLLFQRLYCWRRYRASFFCSSDACSDSKASKPILCVRRPRRANTGYRHKPTRTVTNFSRGILLRNTTMVRYFRMNYHKVPRNI